MSLADTHLLANCNTMEGGVGYYIKCGELCQSFLVRSLDTDMAKKKKLSEASQSSWKELPPFLATFLLCSHTCVNELCISIDSQQKQGRMGISFSSMRINKRNYTPCAASL